MKKLIEFFTTQGVFSDLLTVVIFILGIGSAFLIQREAFPVVDYDIIVVTTVYPGASADEVERLITNPIEIDLKEVDGIKKVKSASIEGRSGISIFLDPDQTTLTEAKADVQDVIDSFKKDLPAGAEDPLILSVNSKINPIIEVSVSGDLSELELRNEARKVQRELEKIKEVAKVDTSGMRDLEIHVKADLDKLSRYQMSLEELIQALQKQNISIPGGTVDTKGGREVIVRTVGDLRTPEDVKKTVIRSNEMANPIRIQDVATVSFGLEKAIEKLRTNGEPAINLVVKKKETADAINLVDNVKNLVNELQGKLDPGVSLSLINDSSKFIKMRLNTLTNNMAVGLVLVIIVLSLLVPGRVALVTAAGIPFAFLGALVIFYSAGITLNMITMMGLIIVTGMLVDDAVVVTENSMRLLEQGKSTTQAAIEGTSQVAAPITASVLTTVVAFLPMMFMSGIMGKFVSFIPMGVILALLISLVECYFILPHHFAKWVKKPNGSRKGFARIFEFTTKFWEEKVTPAYLKILEVNLRKRYWVAFGTILIVGFSVYVAVVHMKKSLFPPEGVEIFFVKLEAPVGTSLDSTIEYLKPIEGEIAKLSDRELDDFVTLAGMTRKSADDPQTRRGSFLGQIVVYLTNEQLREREAKEIIEDIRSKVEPTVPENVKVRFERVNPGPPMGKPIQIGIRGDNYKEIMAAVDDMKKIVSNIEGTTDIQDSFDIGKEEVILTVNSAEAAAAGLNVQAVGTSVRAAFEGIVATNIKELTEEIDVRVSLNNEYKNDIESISKLFVPNPQGKLVNLAAIATTSKEQGIATYEHRDNQRQVDVLGEINEEVVTSDDVTRHVQSILGDFQKKHPNVSIFFGGESEDTEESMASLGRAFIVAALGIFLILVTIFKNLIQPTIILLTIPMGFTGIVWTFFVHGQPWSFMGMLGIVALSGVIVNNAIVFVDFVNENRRKGIERFESIRIAAKQRIRPIFLTTLTTSAGILPTAYGIGGIDKFVVPIALALGWGLFLGSIMTALIFPAAVAILDDFVLLFRKNLPGTSESMDAS